MALPQIKLNQTPRPTAATMPQTQRPVAATMQPTPRPQSPVATTAPTPAPRPAPAPAPAAAAAPTRPTPAWAGAQPAPSSFQKERTAELYQGGMQPPVAAATAKAEGAALNARWRDAPKVNPAALVNPSGAKISGIAAPNQQTGTGPKINRFTGKPMQVGSIGSGYTAPAVAKTTSAAPVAKAATPATAPVKPAVTAQPALAAAPAAKAVTPAAAVKPAMTTPPAVTAPPVTSTTTATTAGTSVTSTPTARPNNPLSKRLASTVQSARSIFPAAQAIAAPAVSAVKGAAKAAWKSLPAIASAAKRSMPAANAATQRAAAVPTPQEKPAQANPEPPVVDVALQNARAVSDRAKADTARSNESLRKGWRAFSAAGVDPEERKRWEELKQKTEADRIARAKAAEATYPKPPVRQPSDLQERRRLAAKANR